MNLIFGDTECGDWENSFGTMRLLRLVHSDQLTHPHENG